MAGLVRTLLIGVALVAVVWAAGWKAWRWAGRAEERRRGEGSVELVVLHWSGEGGPEENAIVEQSLRGFEAANPGIRIRRINAGDSNSFVTKLQTMLAAGEPPDVFYVPFERTPYWASIGLLEPLDGRVAAEDPADPRGIRLADFYPAVVDAFRFDGRSAGRGTLWGIPKDFTPVGFYLNVDLFRKAGIPLPPDDWTWDDYIRIARRIGALTDAEGRHYTGSELVVWSAMVRAYLRTNGLDVRGADFSEVTLGTPEVQAALERLRAWRHDESHTLTAGGSKLTAGAAAFVDGRLGMAGPFGRWVVPEYRRIRDFEWDFRPLPRAADRAPTNIVLTVAWGISAASRHKDEAWRLVRWLTSPEGQAEQSRLGLAVPSLRAVAESPAFLDPSLPPANDAGYLRAAEHAAPLDWPPDPSYDPLLANRLEASLKDATMTVPQAAEDFSRLWSRQAKASRAAEGAPRMPWRTVAVTLAILAGCALLPMAIGWWTRRPASPARRREEVHGLLLASPWLAGLLLFTAFPVVTSALLSLCRWNGLSSIGEAVWVGGGNYATMATQDGRLATSVLVTLEYVLLAVPGGQVVALAAALLMARNGRTTGFFRAAWYLPSVLAGVGVAVLWRWVFDPQYGLLNRLLAPLLGLVGLTPPEWFGRDAATFAVPAFALLSLWSVGGSMMIYVAGLQAIPEELHEAADMDGVGRWRRLWSVTLPMLSPVILFNTLMAVIGSFQVFTSAYVMTAGGPEDLTRFYVLYLFNQGFEFFEMGYASAMAWVLLLATLAVTLLILRSSARLVYYEGMRS